MVESGSGPSGTRYGVYQPGYGPVFLRRSSARATWGHRLECIPLQMPPASSDRLTFSYSPSSSAPAARSEMSLTNSRACLRTPGSEMP